MKGAGAFPKNPAQHAADLQMQEEVKPAFSTAGGPKMIKCIRVDGGSDEGPSHLEVQFWWTLRHIEAPTLATLITTRNSGSSYLNRVELQNGCLACAHANLFIPSNLNGSCFSPDTGKVDMNLLKSNMDSAADIYISRVNQAPCGDSVIYLFKGTDSSWNQKIQDYLSIFLKGTKKRGKLN